MHEPDDIEAQLLTIGRGLFPASNAMSGAIASWCTRGSAPRRISKARSGSRTTAHGRARRLDTQDWIAAVHWSERMCRRSRRAGWH